MRSLFVSLLVILALVFVLAACGNSGNIALATPTPEVSTAPAASPVPSETETAATAPSPAAGSEAEVVDPEIKTVITDFISAQNDHDWDKFTELWTIKAQGFLKDFFAYPGNEQNKVGYFAIEKADILSVFAHYFDIYGSVLTEYETENYKEVRAFKIEAIYHLSKGFWGYSEGINSLELVLVKEDGAWKIARDSLMTDWGPNDDKVYVDHSSHADGTVHSEKQITGYYLATEWGDYAHMIFITIDGEQTELWAAAGIDTEKLPFLQKMQITWTNRDSYIDEAGMVENQDAATDIKLLD